jgi:hypothetical protein
MKRFTFLLLVGCLYTAVSLNAQTCTPTGFFRDGIYMTAAVINPQNPVTGQVNATGCNIWSLHRQRRCHG